MVDKLAHFLRANPSSAFIAADLADLTHLESGPSDLAPAKSIVRSSWLDIVPDDAQIDRESIARGIARIKTDEKHYPKMQFEFEDGRTEFGRLIGEARNAGEVVGPSGFTGTDSAELLKIVNRCDIVANWVTVFNDRYADPSWQAALCEHSGHAVARWWRVAFLYWLLASTRGPDANHRNDWEDSIYVFTASYCDEFWTADKGMAGACTSLFPYVRTVYHPSDRWWTAEAV